MCLCDIRFLLQAKAGAQDGDSEAFTEQFSDDLAHEFEDAMKGFFSNDPGMLQQIEKMAEAAGTMGNLRLHYHKK